MRKGSSPDGKEQGFVTPGAPQWSHEEIVIIVYFLSRQVRPQTLYYLLLRRGYDRPTRTIQLKLVSVTQQHPHLRTSEGHWDLDAVDSWIDDFLGNHESVNTLIRFSPVDAEDMVLVSYPLEVILNLCLLSPAQNRTDQLKSL